MRSFNNKRVTFIVTAAFIVISVIITPNCLAANVSSISSVSTHLLRPANSPMLGPDPYFMLLNNYTNTLYITNLRFGTVSAINGSTDSIEANIPVGLLPTGLGLNEILNRIYVSNYGSGTVSVIDGGSNKVVATINNVGLQPTDIAVDTKLDDLQSLIFVRSEGQVTVINGLTNKVLENVSLSGEQGGMALDPFKKALYVSNSDRNYVSVIQYQFNFAKGTPITNITHTYNIEVGKPPGAIKLSPDRSLLYVVVPDNNSVSVVNTSSNHPRVLRTTNVGSTPTDLGIDNMTGKVYVAHYYSNTISTIDSNNTSNRKDDIVVGRYPFNILVNPTPGIIYVTHISNGVNEIAISSGKLVAGVRFNINPRDAGYIKCNERYTKPYMRYETGTDLSCDAQPNPGFRFSSWSGDRALFSQHETKKLSILDDIMGLLANISGSSFSPNTDPLIKFEVSQYGTLNANFIPNPRFSLPPEFWAAISAIITSFFIPSILHWLNDKRQRRYLREYINKIDSQHDSLDEVTVRNEIEGLYANGKITDSHYQMLKDKVSQYYKNKS
jgi:YVTN family beta-propeller protein